MFQVRNRRGYQKSDSKNSSLTNNNSSTTAENGTVNITTTNDTNIIGANLLAKDVNLNVGHNLNISSLQNESHGSGSSEGMNIGGGANSGGGGSASFGINRGKHRTDRVWVDDQTSIIGTGSVTINTSNNTDVKGAVIANLDSNGNDLGNLSITTNTLTYSDIKDKDESYSSGFNFSTNLTFGGSNPGDATKENTTADKSKYPGGSTTIGMNSNGYLKEQVTRATIGNGTINTGSDVSNLNRDITKSQEVTKDTITGALNFETTLDNRLFDPSGKGQKEIWGEQKNFITNTVNNPLNPVKVSRNIDENNGEAGAPNLLPGIFKGKFNASEVGRDYERDPVTGDKIIPSFPKSLASGTKANPFFRTLNYILPGFTSSADYHDHGMQPINNVERGKLEKAYTIPGYFVHNYYGSVGTILDVSNWQWTNSLKSKKVK
jgi:hypothetical protein